MKPAHLLALLLSLAPILAWGSSAFAPRTPAREVAAGPATPPGSQVPLAMVMAQVETSTGGKVVGARQAVDRAGKPVYVLKVLMPDGVVRVIRVDPATGQTR